MYNPFVFGKTQKVSMTVTSEEGGLLGLTLLGVSGIEATVLVNNIVPQYPYTLQAGDVLSLERTNASADLTILRAAYKVTEGSAVSPPGTGTPSPESPPTHSVFPEPASTGLKVEAGENGYLRSADIRISSTADGFLKTDSSLVREQSGILSEV